MKLALHIIAKDETDQLVRICKEYGQYFDEIAIAYDSDVDLLRQNLKWFKNVKIYPYKWIDDFADKRNFLVDKTESDYYLRLDTDDSIANPEYIRRVFDEASSSDVDVVYIPYIYSQDQDGNCNAKHWRETIIKKSKNCYWKKPVHENIYIEDQKIFNGVKDKRLQIIHNITPDHAEKSAERNYRILLKEFERDGDNTDLRTIAYLGRMLIGWGEHKKALYFLEKLAQQSGWDDDKYYAFIHMAQCHLHLKDTNLAIACCNEAMSVNTEFPDAYLTLCEIYIDRKDFKKALHWGLIGLSKPEPDTLFVLDPSLYTYRAVMNIAIAYYGTGDFEKAKRFYDKASQIAPSNEFIQSQRKLFEDGIENQEYFKKLAWLVCYLKEKDKDKLTSLIHSIPKNMLKDERIMSLRHKFLPPKTWDDKSVAIWCGETYEEWAPPSVVKGVGGSEEAVIYLSKELQQLGYKVTVYNNCGDFEGEYSGVQYKPFHDFNVNDTHNIVISWRRNVFTGAIKAKRKLIWLHDVPSPGQFPKGCEKNFDKIIVLSEYHKSLLPDTLPNDKIFVSSNGINLADFMLNGALRNPKRMIYTSSYDRGIQHLLQMWPDIRKEVPDAELHLFYGWQTYDNMMREGYRSPEFKRDMMKLMDQEGVFEHGRIGHKKLVKEFQKSSIFVYPSHFEEISCISAMKAQACGCVPVTTDYAALRETVKVGMKVSGKCGVGDTNERYKKALINMLQHENLQQEYRDNVLKHKDEFGWDRVAKQWSENLF
jgi:glycosyltransferase involved in cell wall biosynthesis